MSALKPVLLHNQFNIQCSVEEFDKKILSPQDKGFSVTKIDTNEYKFLSDVSFGTLRVGANWGEGIKVYGSFMPTTNSFINVTLYTKLRVELIIIGIIGIVFFITNGDNTESPSWVKFIFPLLLIWNFFVYRFQENRLKQKVTDYLHSL